MILRKWVPSLFKDAGTFLIGQSVHVDFRVITSVNLSQMTATRSRKRDKISKVVSVRLLADHEVKEFTFILDFPGFKADHLEADFENLYTQREIVEGDLPGLRDALQKLPCCVLGGDRKTPGDPLNLAFVGDSEHVLAPFIHRNWHLTERIHAESV
jgi:hypothetical protein